MMISSKLARIVLLVRVAGEKKQILDIDDTFCTAHGGQQLAFWNAHQDERGFSPMHIYHARSGAPVVAILRSAKTPKGTEVRTVVKHAYPLNSGGIACNMSANKELGHEASYARRSVAGFPQDGDGVRGALCERGGLSGILD
jgi:hypothetical protein